MTTETQGEPMVRSELLEEGTVLKLVLNRPKANILTLAMMQALSEALAAHESNPHLKLVILRGAGNHFSFGASVEEHQRDHAAGMLAGFHKFVRRLASYPIPVAALVEGQCLGGGFEVVLCCHFVFASPTAVFACPEIKLGVFPPVLASVGPIRLGAANAERLVLTGGNLDAAAAKQAGLVTEILQPGEKSSEELLLAWYEQNLQPLSGFVLRQAARAARIGSGILRALDKPLAQIERHYVEDLVPSFDGNEGIAAFLERRKPQWEDK
jgi:cyclohexa-1,5-dienecarbonyl-CoA hydratase